MKPPFLLDTTLRDGSFVVRFQFSLEQVSVLSSRLSTAGVDFIEVSHGGGVGTGQIRGVESRHSDLAYVLAARAAVRDGSAIGVIAIPPRTTLENMAPLWEHIDFVRLGVTADQSEISFDLAAETKKRGKKLFIQLMRSSSLPLATLVNLGKTFDFYSPEATYVVDTSGSYSPDEVRQVLLHMKTEIKSPIGFHGHDHLGNALENTRVALDAGATYIDGCLAGMGKGPGNAKTEELADVMKERFGKNLNCKLLVETAQSLVVPLLQRYDTDAQAIHLLNAMTRLDLPNEMVLAIREHTGFEFKEIFSAFARLPNFFNIDEASITEVVRGLLLRRDGLIS